MERITLNNGLTIYYYSIPNAYSTSIGLYIKAGSRNEPNNQNGITHMLEHLHFRRLEELSQKHLYLEMDKIGANLKASTHKELLRFYMKLRPCYFNKAIDLFRKIILTDNWCEAEFEAEKQVVLNELYEKNSYTCIEPIIDSIVWKKHALSNPIIGTADTINSLTIEKVMAYKNTIFSKDNIAVIITGNINEEMVSYSNKCLSKVNISESFSAKTSDYPYFCTRKPDIKLTNCSWDYVDINLAFDVDMSIGIHELTILNSILGGGTGSRLQYVLREEMGLTYSIYSYLEAYSDYSIIHISLSTHKNNIFKCLRTIVFVLNDLKVNITNNDMDTNMPYYTDNLWYLLEDSEKLNLELGWDLFNNDRLYSVEERIKQYSKLTKSQLMNDAKNIFLPENLSIAILGSVGHITQKQLREITIQLKTNGDVMT